ncbi:hypothetical protein I7I51_06910 [Histoplasma capsulatum]|uniref:Uncharacterized protein n=1 Tax=Ajellomyces capsulatus TaxID=5037 RepID=A0A8A1MJH8_AJECA|nr:hypothetical protein I7I51_06910 [Histoplasma capsulatum]
MASISVSERLIEFNHIYYVSELSANLISAEFMKHQSYIYCDMYVDTGNYFEFLSFTDSNMFYANLSRNNIYILSNNPSIFDGIMNNSEYGGMVYVAVSRLTTVFMEFNLNTDSLEFFI